MFNILKVDQRNELRAQSVIECLSAAEFCDPRFMIVLAYARIHMAINELIDQRAAKQTNGRRPGTFRTATSALNRAGCFERGYYDFLRRFGYVRNQICHRDTDCETLSLDTHGDIQAMHESSQLVWPYGADSPQEDLHRSVFAMCVSGCLAIELDFDGPKKGFDALRGYLIGRDLGAIDGVGRAG